MNAKLLTRQQDLENITLDAPEGVEHLKKKTSTSPQLLESNNHHSQPLQQVRGGGNSPNKGSSLRGTPDKKYPGHNSRGGGGGGEETNQLNAQRNHSFDNNDDYPIKPVDQKKQVAASSKPSSSKQLRFQTLREDSSERQQLQIVRRPRVIDDMHIIEQGSSSRGNATAEQDFEMDFQHESHKNDYEGNFQHPLLPKTLTNQIVIDMPSQRQVISQVHIQESSQNSNLSGNNYGMQFEQLNHQNSLGSDKLPVGMIFDGKSSSTSSQHYETPIPQNFPLAQNFTDGKFMIDLNSGGKNLTQQEFVIYQKMHSLAEIMRHQQNDYLQTSSESRQRQQEAQQQVSSIIFTQSNRSHANEQQQSSSSSGEEQNVQQVQIMRILSADHSNNPNFQRVMVNMGVNTQNRYPSQQYNNEELGRFFKNYQQNFQISNKSSIYQIQRPSSNQNHDGLEQIKEAQPEDFEPVDIDQLVLEEKQLTAQYPQNPSIELVHAVSTPVSIQGPQSLHLVKQSHSSSSPFHHQRFNKQFFEELKSQQIGFATILKERRNHSFIHSSAQQKSTEEIKEEGTLFAMSNEGQKDYGGGIGGESTKRSQQRQLLAYYQNMPKEQWLLKRKNTNFLMDLQKRIEFNNQMKNNIERAIILFNEKPKKGIDFLISNQFLDYDPENVAEFLLTTPGLSKFAIGQFLGTRDEFNIAVLRSYCQKIDFTGMEADEALRFFLSQFRLPVESEQIDRVMENFSMTYFADNPTDFEPPNGQGGVDSVYMLSYSLIFLNTLNHNPNVPTSRKKTLQTFIKENLAQNPGFPVYKLEAMYNRIMNNEFKTDTQYVEKIYERIRAFNHEEKTTKDTIKRSTNVLQTGEHFLKFGRMGKPHMRFVYVSDDEECIFWCELSKEEQMLQQEGMSHVRTTSNNQRQAAHSGGLLAGFGTSASNNAVAQMFGKSKIKCIKCEDIVDIKVGYNASPVLKRHQLPIEFDDLIFSIQTKTRTLDLQAKTSEVRNRWVKFLKLIQYELEQKTKSKEFTSMNIQRERKRRIKIDLEEIWEQDIMTNFSAHWDYINHCPKKTQLIGPLARISNFSGGNGRRSLDGATNKNSSTTGKLLCKLASCSQFFIKRRRSNKPPHSIIDVESHGEFSPQMIDFESEADNGGGGRFSLGSLNQNGRGFLLEQLWRRGIPPKFRQKLWPFIIQNKLELTKKLYKMNLQEGQQIVNRIKKQVHVSKKGINKHILEKIDQDIRSTLKYFQLNQYHSSDVTPLNLEAEEENTQLRKSEKLRSKGSQKHIEEETKHEVFSLAQKDIDDNHLTGSPSVHSGEKFLSHKSVSVRHRINTLSRRTQIDEEENENDDQEQQYEAAENSTKIVKLRGSPERIRQNVDLERLREVSPHSNISSNEKSGNQKTSIGGGEENHQVTYERMFNLIISFIMYRPDLGNLPNISYIAGMFLLYCNDYDAYVGFTNFIHQHYFFDLFKGNLSDIKIRIDQFNKYFSKLMPDLFKHFETLDITTDLFLIDWMLTLYSKLLQGDLDLISRIWDNFLLDGEIFAIKTGLALLQYRESELMNQSYYRIIKVLRGNGNQQSPEAQYSIAHGSDNKIEECTNTGAPPRTEVNHDSESLKGDNRQTQKARYTSDIDEDKLFKLIDAIETDHENYYQDLKMQKWSYQKSKILGGVFK